MKRFSPVIPLIYGAIIFLTVRIANDIPRHDNYLGNPWWFIAVELAAVAVGAYAGFYLTVAWRRHCARRRPSAIIEYGTVAVMATVICGLVTMCSNGLRLFHEPGHFTIPLIVTALISLWLYLWLKSADMARALDEARAERLKAELAMLKAQYHPHFLFNMLNTIYFLIDRDNSRARDAVESLASLLRHQLYSSDGKTGLDDEIKAIGDYIALSRLRFGDRMKVEVDITTTGEGAQIYPHLLMPLVENAFKHCAPPYGIKIEISLRDGLLTLCTANSCTSAPEGEPGTGLRNLERRLELLYPGRYGFTTRRGEGEFTSRLDIRL